MWKSIEVGLVRLLLLIDSVIYGFVADLFEIFVELANASSKIFTESAISSFANRIYVIVGVVALFIISYQLINAIINPDNLTKGNNSGAKLVMNLVTSIVLVALVPTIFNYAYKLQDVILNDNIVGKVFLGNFSNQENLINTDTGEVIDNSYVVKQYGSQLSWSVLNAFFYTTNEDLYTSWSPWGEYKTISDGVNFVACGGAILLVIGSGVATYFSAGAASGTIPTSVGVAVAACGATTVNSLVANTGHLITSDTIYWKGMTAVAQLGDFGLITAFAEEILNGNVIYMPIISTIVGLILLYMIFSYCLDLGLRAVKLAFYQMIAPIPIFSRIIPNNKIFNNWIRLTLTTFMEVFIRMIVLFTVIFLSSNIGELNIPGGLLVKMIIIMGIVTFARQAPKLISDLTGIDSGNMKLGIMEKLGAGGALAAGALIGGGITAGVKNFTNSWRNTNGNRWQKLGAGLKSGFAGTVSGGVRSAKGAGFKAKSWGDMKNAASAGSKAAHNKSKDRAAYKASHGGTLGGVIKGHASDAWSGVKNWAGVTSGVLEKVDYQEEYLAGFDDYKSLYNNGSYQAMEAQLNQYEARIAAEGGSAETYSGSGITLDSARKSLEEQMRLKRLEAIEKNTDGAAYTMYNLAMQVRNNQALAAAAGVDPNFIKNADDFELRNGKIYHKNGGTVWTHEELQKLLEGRVATHDPVTGKINGDINDPTTKMYGMSKGLGESKKDVAKDKNQTKRSIAYKEAKKAKDSQKS
ncbi:MAG: hypothetical protein IJN03_00250 [Bacilli bacterium]|nr:hypothetical protein [Bacilli bacterium]